MEGIPHGGGLHRGAVVLAAAIFLCWCCFLWRDAEATHVEHLSLQSTEPLSVGKKHRSGFHFQPRKNWINDPNAPMYYGGYYHLFYQYNPDGAEWRANLVWAHSVSKDLINWDPLPVALHPTADFDTNGCWSGSATILPDGRPAILYTGIDLKNHQVQNVAFPANLSDPLLVNWTKPDYNPIISPVEPTLPSAFRDPAPACYSPDGRPAILYTCVDPKNRQVQNVTFPANLSDPLLVHSTIPDYNPIISPVEPILPSNFRDPSTAWYGPDGHWRVVIGACQKDRGLALLYRSRDFCTWIKATHALHSSPRTGMWECPDFYPVSTAGTDGIDTSAFYGTNEYRHVLKVSLFDTKHEYYTIGTYDTMRDRYVPDSHLNDNHTGLQYDYGNFYASKTFYDPSKQRRILWGWANESNSVSADVRKGWAGIQIIPRKIWLDEGGMQLLQWPVEEIEKLRGDMVEIEGVPLRNGGTIYHVKGFKTSQADVEVTFEVKDLEKAEPFDPRWLTDPEKLCGEKGAEVTGGVGPFGLLVLATVDRSEQTAVFFRVFKDGSKYRVLSCHDPRKSTTMEDVYKPTFGGFVDVDIAEDKQISLRVLVDNSVIESFAAGGRTCITSRVYPLFAEGQFSTLFAFNNGETDVEVSKLRAWKMNNPHSMN